jgi:NAD(P)-dependent dehydrogenase (short-subunit alcohol dehydrogenase family)
MELIDFKLENKVAIITGAARGNGFAIAKALESSGAKCLLIDLNFDDKIKTNTDYLYVGDVKNHDFINQVMDEALKISSQLILVNNAGVTFPEENSYSFEKWSKTLDVNLTAPFLWMEAVRANCHKISSGSIINITSLAAERAFPNNPAYIASKGGLKMLSKAYAMELSAHNIRVNCIGPGYIKTEMTKNSYSDEIKQKNREKHTLLSRWGEPCDLGGAAIFLASDASSYITGQDIYVDGGWLTRGLIEY